MGIISDIVGGISKVGSALAPAAPFLEVGATLYDMFRDRKSRSAQDMRTLLGASVDPTDPRFKNIAALFEAKAKEDAIRGVQEAMRAERAARARGDTVVTKAGAELSDTGRYNAIARAFQDAGRMGNLQAMQSLTGTAPQYSPLVGYEERLQNQRSADIGSVAGGIAELLRGANPATAYGGTHAFDPTYTQRQAMDANYFDFDDPVLRGGF